ncbi:MAG TPA: hypothetical protein VHO06_26785 [Polyangia bacterium]|nr:hypothetical protein [Polyangia bacterium]
MESGEAHPALGAVLEGQPAGVWVVLDPDMTRILASANTPEEALRNAHLESTEFDRLVGERPVVLQVPDPQLLCLY